MSGQQIDTSVNTSAELYQAGGAGQNAIPEVVQDDFAELVEQTIQQELRQAGIAPPYGPGGAGTGEISPEAEQKLAEGDIAGFIEQMVKDALEEAGLIPPSSEGQGTEGSGSDGGSGGAENAGGGGEPNELVDQIMQALEEAGAGGQGGGGMLGQSIGDQIEKLIEGELEEAGITPNVVQGNEQQTNGYVPANDAQLGDTGGIDDDTANNFVSRNVLRGTGDGIDVDRLDESFAGNGFDVENPEPNISGSEFSQSSSTSRSINGVTTESNTQFDSNGGNGNFTSRTSNGEIPNAA